MYFIDVEHSNSFRMWNRENIFVASEGVIPFRLYENGEADGRFYL